MKVCCVQRVVVIIIILCCLDYYIMDLTQEEVSLIFSDTSSEVDSNF